MELGRTREGQQLACGAGKCFPGRSAESSGGHVGRVSEGIANFQI